MAEQKDKQKISDIFFGKAEEVFTNVRLFLRFKKAVKIVGQERKAVEETRAKIARLYSARQAKLYGTTKNKKSAVSSEKKSAALVPTSPQPSPYQGEGDAELKFVPLSEIAKNSTYSKNYINFSARQGKLKAEKIKGVWHTTEAWLADFTEKSLAKKNEFKEKLSKDHGGNKKFAKTIERGDSISTKEIESPKVADLSLAKKEEEIGSFPLLKAEIERETVEKKKAKEKLKNDLKKAVAPQAVILQAKKSFAKSWSGAKNWVRDLGRMEGAKEIAKLRKAKLGDFWKSNYAKPAAAMIALVLLMAIGNVTKADLASLGDQGKKQIYFAYNASVDTVAKVAGAVNESAGKKIAQVKVGKEKFVKIASDILQRAKIKDFEKNTGLALKGDQDGKINIVNQEQGGAVLAASVSQSETSASQGEDIWGGRVLAAATGAAQTNIGDIEVSAYLMDGENKELSNGQYVVRFGIYTTDRIESDPYPSDTDKGARVWEETQTVTVENGLLKTYLGAVTPIPANFNFAASNYYIGIRVGEDAEMTPRKRIGAVPLARTAMNIAGQSIGNGAGNIPVSNGTLNTNLNADLLDGQHAAAFQVAGSYQPAGSYDNYLSWKLQSSATDAGQKITTNKGAIFAGGNGIVTTRTLNTLTVSLDPTYSPTFTDITLNGNLNLAASTNLIFGGATSLGETTAPNDSGAYLVGANDEFVNSASTNVQAVLKDLDAAIAGGGPGALWTLAAGTIHPTDQTNSLAVGTANQFQVTNTGNVTAGTYNGNTITAGTGTMTLHANILTLNGNAALNQNLENTSSPTFAGMTLTGLSGVLKATAGAISGSATTADLPENTNLYYTDARARSAISTTATGLTYTSGTGILSLTANYVIPTTTQESNWGTAYTKRVDTWNAPLSFAGNAASLNYNATNLQLTLNALNTIQDIAASSSPTFVGMTLNGNLTLGANTLTTTNETVITHLNADLLDGNHGAYYASATSISGTQNLIAKFATTTTVGDSRIFDNGTNIGIGNTNPLTYLNIGNSIYMTALGGNVGIGTTNPTNLLSVAGNTNVTGHMAIGNAAAIDGGSLWLANFDSIALDVEENAVGDFSTGIFGTGTWINAKTTADNSAGEAAVSIFTTDPTDTHSWSFISGGDFESSHQGSGHVSTIDGSVNYGSMTNGSADALIGVEALTAITGGAVTDMSGIRIDSSSISGGTVDNLYGLYIQNQTGASHNWSLYSNSDAASYFKGNVGIGTTNPLSKLSINGGLHVGGDSDAGDNNLLVDGTATSTGLLTASNGLALTTGALNLTATSGVLTVSGLSESSVSTGANNLLFTSGNFNTTATGINSTAIGVTTASTGAFTTLSATGQFTSTLADGTAPFAVTSTTMSTNLNADLLDGQHGNYYAAATSISGTENYLAKFGAGGSIIGNSTIFDNGSFVGIGGTAPSANPYLYVASGGNVGIGTTNPGGLLDVNGTSWLRGTTGGTGGLYVDSNGRVGIGTTAPGTKALYVNGESTLSSSVKTFSYFISTESTTTTPIAGVNISTSSVASAGTPVRMSPFLSFDANVWDTGLAAAVAKSFYIENLPISGNPASAILQLRSTDNGGIMAITNTGNVGIGTTSPTQKLQVNGGIKVTGAFISETSANSAIFDESGGNLRFTALGPNVGTRGGLVFNIKTSDQGFNLTPIQVGNTGNVYLAQDQLVGGFYSVGIGTTNPDTRLHVSQVTSETGGQTFNLAKLESQSIWTGTGDANTTYALNFSAAAFTNGWFYNLPFGSVGFNKPASWNGASSVRNSDFIVSPAVAGTLTERFRITSAGNVGIGTTSPGAKLQVASIYSDSNANYNGYFPVNSNATVNGAYTNYAMVGAISPNINTGVTNTGTSYAVIGSSIANTAQTGTMANVVGVQGQAGISSGGMTVTNAYGIRSIIYAQAGTIDNSFGVFISTPIPGGTITNQWGLYQEYASAKNYFAGNVGIGTTNPGSKLQVNGNAVIGYSANTAGPSNGLAISGSLGVGTAAPSFQFSNNSTANMVDQGALGLSGSNSINWSNSDSGYGIGLYNSSANSDAMGLLVKIKGTASTNRILTLGTGSTQTGAGTDVFVVQGSGNVGIGTTSPGFPLHVVGTIRSSTPAAGSELIANGTFNSNISSWTDNSGSPSNISWSASYGGSMLLTGAVNYARADQAITTVPGTVYKMNMTIKDGISAVGVYAGTTLGGSDLLYNSATGVGTHSFTFIATGTTTYIRLYTGYNGIYLDDVSVLPYFASMLADGPVLAAKQANGTPSFAFSDDPDTGFGSYLSDLLSFYAGGTMSFNARAGGVLNFGTWSMLNSGTTANIIGAQTDGATAYALKIGNENALSTAGSKIVGFFSDNMTTEKAYIGSGGGAYFAGNVGIGTTSPGSSLQVNGNAVIGYADGTATTANGLAISGNVGIGTTAPTNALAIVSSPDISSASRSGESILSTFTGTLDNNYVGSGLTSTAINNAAPNGHTLAVYGGIISGKNEDSYLASSVYGVQAGGLNVATSGTIPSVYGIYAYAQQNGAGGTITNAYSMYATTAQTAGTITNGYGLYVGAIGGTNNWGVYQSSSSNKNYFAGNVGIGTTSPGSTLQVNGNAVIGYSANTGTTGSLAISGNVGIGTTSPSGKLNVYNNSWPSFVINSADNVGVGIVPSSYRMDINGSLHSTSYVLGSDLSIEPIIGGQSAVTSWWGLQLVGNKQASVNYTPSNVGTGISDYGVVIPMQQTTAAGLAILGIGSQVANYFEVTSNANKTTQHGDVFTIQSSGNVGIGTTSPLLGLHVQIGGTSGLTGVYGSGLMFSTDSASGARIFLESTIASSDQRASTLYNSGGKTILGSLSNNGGAWIQRFALVMVHTSGNIGIGEASPGSKLSVLGGISVGETTDYSQTAAPTGGMIIKGNVGIGTTSPNRKLEVNGSIRMGALVAGGGGGVVVYRDPNGDLADATSSIQYKNNVQTMEPVLSKVMDLRAVRFDWNSKTSTPGMADFGMIAEEVNNILPDLVTFNPDGSVHGLKYEKMGLFALKAIQEQQTQIADVVLKTSQNVETVGQLQKSVDDNLTVISSNFSAVDAKLALHDTQFSGITSQLAGLDAQISNINSHLTSLDTQTSAIVSQVSSISGNMSLNEAEKSDLEARLSAAESKLQTDEKNLTDFEKGTNDTLSAMLVTENMLTDEVTNHEDRIKVLEAKLATLAVSTDGATVTIPANVITQDASGNATLAGIFTAKGIVAGSVDAKNLKLGAQTSGSGTLKAGQTEIIIPSTEAKADSKIYVTPTGSTFGKILYVGKEEKDIVPGESFKVKFDGDPAAKDIPFNWLVVN